MPREDSVLPSGRHPLVFEQVIEPLIRRLATEPGGHVLVPAPWCPTGLGPRDLRRAADLPSVHRAILDDADHPRLRSVFADRQGLIDYVRARKPVHPLRWGAGIGRLQRFTGAMEPVA
jgi:hypothetical protein